MKKTLLATAALLLSLPAYATPVRLIVEPNEQMVVVPGLEILGTSRISTVEWCQEVEGVKDWRNLVTDSDFDFMEACLIEHL